MHYEWNAVFNDRDGKSYRAHIQHVTPKYEGPRITIDKDRNPLLFRSSAGQLYRLTKNGKALAIHEEENLSISGQEYRCLLAYPQTPDPFATIGNGPGEMELTAAKIPIVDLMVDFTPENSAPVIRHVGNVRHLKDITTGPTVKPMPYYTEKHAAAAPLTAPPEPVGAGQQ